MRQTRTPARPVPPDIATEAKKLANDSTGAGRKVSHRRRWKCGGCMRAVGRVCGLQRGIRAHTSSYLGIGRFSSRVELPIDSCSALRGVFRAVLLRLIFFCRSARNRSAGVASVPKPEP